MKVDDLLNDLGDLDVLFIRLRAQLVLKHDSPRWSPQEVERAMLMVSHIYKRKRDT